MPWTTISFLLAMLPPPSPDNAAHSSSVANAKFVAGVLRRAASGGLLSRIEREDVHIDTRRLRHGIQNGRSDIFALELLHVAEPLCHRRTDVGTHLRDEFGLDSA